MTPDNNLLDRLFGVERPDRAAPPPAAARAVPTRTAAEAPPRSALVARATYVGRSIAAFTRGRDALGRITGTRR